MGACGSDEPTASDSANGDVQTTDGSDWDTDTQEDDATLTDGSSVEPDVSDVGPDIAGTDGQSADAGWGDVLDDTVQLRGNHVISSPTGLRPPGQSMSASAWSMITGGLGGFPIWSSGRKARPATRVLHVLAESRTESGIPASTPCWSTAFAGR